MLLEKDASLRKFTGSFYNVDGYVYQSMSSPQQAASDTWTTRCSHVVFFASGKAHLPSPAVKLKTKSDIKSWASLREISQHIAKKYLDEYEWFLLVEEDTFIIMENLAYYLAVHNSSKAWYFGHSYTGSLRFNYNVAGAGTVLSKGALRRLSNKLALGHCPVSWFRSAAGDQAMAECLSELGIHPQDTRDHLGRARFLLFRPESHVVAGSIPWNQEYWTKSTFVSGEVSLMGY